MQNKFKTATITIMTAAMSAMPQVAHANDTTTTNEKITNAAGRITVGSVVKSETKEDPAKDLSITEYHIDQDGDGRADVIRNCINRDGDIYVQQTTYSPFSVVEFIETYDEKHHMWNIIQTNVIDSRKIKMIPQKTR